MAYTYYVFFYFVPLVFMGAFFLLNLVLAVINNSFSENQKKSEEELKRIEAEKNKLKKKRNDDEEEMNKALDEGEDEDDGLKAEVEVISKDESDSEDSGCQERYKDETGIERVTRLRVLDKNTQEMEAISVNPLRPLSPPYKLIIAANSHPQDPPEKENGNLSKRTDLPNQ